MKQHNPKNQTNCDRCKIVREIELRLQRQLAPKSIALDRDHWIALIELTRDLLARAKIGK